MKKICAKVNSQVIDIIHETVPKLTTNTNLSEATVQLVMNKVETDLKLVLELFPLSEESREIFEAQSQFKVETAIFKRVENIIKDDFFSFRGTFS